MRCFGKMLNESSFYFVESPFQVLSAAECLALQQTQRYTIFVRLNGSAVNDFQIKTVVDELSMSEHVRYLPIPQSANSSFFQKIRSLIIIMRLSIYALCSSRIYLGDLDSIVGWLFLKLFTKKVIVLDDGLKSIVTSINFRNVKYFTYLKNIELGLIDGINGFEFLKEKLPINKISFRHKYLFLGDKLVGMNSVSAHDYITAIEKALNILNIDKSDVLYLPHREESESCIDLVKNKLELKIYKNNEPLEFSLIKGKFLCEGIIGFFSAGLLTSLSLGGYKNHCISFNSSMYLDNKSVYDYLIEQGVDPVFFECIG